MTRCARPESPAHAEHVAELICALAAERRKNEALRKYMEWLTRRIEVLERGQHAHERQEGAAVIVSGNRKSFIGAAARGRPVASAHAAVSYALPASGAALAIEGTGPSGSNAVGIKPAAIADSTDWDRALFNSFGGGIVVPDYSAAGAYVIAGSGGHNHPENIGAAIFNFQNATWTRLDPQGGSYRSDGYPASSTSGSPWYEITGSSGVPATAHPYLTLSRIPASASFPNGGVLYPGRGAVCVEAATASGCHALNLANGVWSRYSDGSNATQFAGNGYEDSCTVYDAARGRYWITPWSLHSYDRLDYFNPATGQYATTAAYSSYLDAAVVGSPTMLYGTCLVRVGVNGRLFFCDPDDIATSWTELTVSDAGSLQTSISRYHEMAYFPSSGCFYTLGLSGGNTLIRVRPPASNPRGGTWTIDSVTVTGDTLPARTTSGSAVQHGRGLVYVPGIDRLAWFPGGTAAVYLIHPGI